MVVRRFPLLLLLAAALLGTAAATAWADELVVLDNGSVLKGAVVRETKDDLVLRLSGFDHEAQVTIAKSRITRRHDLGDTGSRTTLLPVNPGEEATPAPTVAVLPPSHERTHAIEPPRRFEVEIEPSLESEGFFERLARVAARAIPQDPVGQTTLAALFVIALMAVVGMGGRMAEIETLTLPRSILLSLLLGAMLVADVLARGEMLRADRALWILPGQAALWLGVAALVLRENLGRIVLLFAFVLFSILTSGAILVAF
jgi:hypothetical protein